MSLAERAAVDIPAHELEAMWRHQLKAPLLFDLNAYAPNTESITQMTHADERTLETFGDLLADSHPPADLLRLVKEFAKSESSGDEPALPKVIGSALYYAAIVAARVRCGQRISGLSDAELRRGLEWAGQQTWLDSRTRGFFASALQTI
jgi:hypothetical protein